MPKIVVLEDDEILLNLLKDMLKLEGYEVIGLENFENVLPDLREKRPQGIILDVQLNGGNGLDFLDQIRQDELLKDIYVLVSSGMDYAKEAKQRGADDFIMKPYMPDELIQLLGEKIKM